MMRDRTDELKRRAFLKSGILAAGSAVTLSGRKRAIAAPHKKEISTAQGIPVRRFGKTGHKLPILAMGGSAFVRMFIKAYGMPLESMDDRVATVRHAYDRGIRYFDTARVYGESESIVGQGLKGVRDNVYIATKCHMTEPAKVRGSVEKSLEQLGTDYADCVQIHSPAIERVGWREAMKLHAELEKLRDEGLLRFIGLTTHVAFEDVYRMISTGGFDQVLLAYGYFRKGMDTRLSNRKLEFRQLCLSKAHQLGMGIVAMKVMGANILSHNAKNVLPDYDAKKRDRLPPAAIRWVLKDDRISLLNIGVSTQSDIDKNIATLSGNLKLTDEDSELLADFSARAYESPMVKAMPLT